MKKNIIYGLRPIYEALEANVEIDKVLLRRVNDMKTFAELKHLLRQRFIPYQFVPEAKLDILCPSRTHQGAIAFISAVIYQPYLEIIQRTYENGDVPLLVLLDSITDVRNMGAIARSAECFGAHALILPMQGTARVDADAVKTSAGALNHLPVCRAPNIYNTIYELQDSGIFVVSASDHAKDLYFEVDYTAPVCLVMGSEGQGVAKRILQDSDASVRIPTSGKIESLNVSVAAGILLAEIYKQRIQK